MSRLRDLPLRELLVQARDELSNRRSDSTGTQAGEAAWSELHRRIHLLAHRLAFPLDADDVTQRVLLRLQDRSRLAAASDSGNATAYLFQIVRNEARELAREESQEERLRGELEVEVREAAAPGEADLDPTERIGRALSRLSEADRTLLRLRFWNSLSVGEIAQRLGITYSATAVRLFRALGRLRAELT